MNRVQLIGRLTRDPELRTTASNLAVSSFSIAVDRRISREDREAGKQSADFINVVVFGKPAENLARYMSKGRQIAVEGRIQTRNYDAQDGTKRYVTEVICDNVTFLGSKNSNSKDDSSFISEPSSDIETTNLDEDPYANMGDEVALTDDDLPFDFN